jgi:hypothetical protein
MDQAMKFGLLLLGKSSQAPKQEQGCLLFMATLLLIPGA